MKGEAPGKRSSHQLTALGTDLFSPVFSSFFSTTELEWIPLNTSALGATHQLWSVWLFHAVGNHLISLEKTVNALVYKFLPSTMEWTEIGTLPPDVTTDTDIMEDVLDQDAYALAVEERVAVEGIMGDIYIGNSYLVPSFQRTHCS